MSRVTGTAVLVVLMMAGAPAAHHSYAPYENTATEFDGVIRRIEWVNPHVLLTLETATATYTVEWAAVNAMARRGIAADTLAAGDRVIVSGLARRDVAESGLVALRGIRRPIDGWHWPAR